MNKLIQTQPLIMGIHTSQAVSLFVGQSAIFNVALMAIFLATSLPAMAQENAILFEGTFVERFSHTEGSYRIESSNGKVLLRTGEDFHVKPGPDLHLMLSTKTAASVADADLGDTAVIALLEPGQATQGPKEYAMPEGLDLARYRSLLVVCIEFGNLAYGAADLSEPVSKLRAQIPFTPEKSGSLLQAIRRLEERDLLGRLLLPAER